MVHGKKLAAIAALIAVGVAALAKRVHRNTGENKDCLKRLRGDDADTHFARVSHAALEVLPAPVARYFRYALQDGQPLILSACYRQIGALRTDIHSARWFDFEATQRVAPASRSFTWDASVYLLSFLRLHVRDGYVAGRGSGKVSLMSVPIAKERGGAEMNSGALHRYLAEAVWYPTALLPASGVLWSAIDDRRALATLTDSDITVSLEFTFGDAGQVTGIYTPGRWGKFKAGFRKTAWEGHFGAYEERSGMRIPFNGEVGWYEGNQWLPVWKGQLLDASYALR